MLSHMSLIGEGIRNRNMHEDKSYQGYGTNPINVIVNSTITSEFTFQGTDAKNGSCKGVNYTLDGQLLEDVVMQVSISIKAQTSNASLQRVLSRCRRQGMHLGTKLSRAYDQMDVIFELGSRHRQPRRRKIHCSWRIIKGVRANGTRTSWLTKHPRLIVMKFGGYGWKKLRKRGGQSPTNTDLAIYINFKFLYVEQSHKRDLDILYTQTVRRRCLLHREVLRNRLLLAPLAADLVSIIIKKRLGWIGRVLFYILQFGPMVATWWIISRCLWHWSPIYLLHQYAQQIECLPLVPPLYFLKGQWAGFNPTPIYK